MIWGATRENGWTRTLPWGPSPIGMGERGSEGLLTLAFPWGKVPTSDSGGRRMRVPLGSPLGEGTHVL